LDWDSTVQPKYRPQAGAEIGYNPGQPGRRSFHPLMAVVAKTRLCPVYRFRSGDTVSASQWQDAMADDERWLGDRQIALNRGDLGFGHDAIMSWHDARTLSQRHQLRFVQKQEVNLRPTQGLQTRFETAAHGRR
jgi:hypothetical protein